MQPIDPAQRQLLKAFRITEDDLVTNQLGQLSDRQVRNLWRYQQDMRRKYRVTFSRFMRVSFDISLFYILPFFAGFPLQEALVYYAALTSGLLLLMQVVLVIRAARNNYNEKLREMAAAIQTDIDGLMVQRHTGPVKTTLLTETGGTLFIGEGEFKVDRRAFHVFRDGRSYTVYVAPNSRWVISADLAASP